MFEARLAQGKIFKLIIDAIKDLVTDCNLDCSEEEVSIQSMDSAHVSLVAVRLSSAAFDHYRCDRPNSLGLNTANMSKIFKMLNGEDTVTFKAEDNADALTMLFEGGKSDTIADFGKSSLTLTTRWHIFSLLNTFYAHAALCILFF
jgi:proliferating cell nuclear antigen